MNTLKKKYILYGYFIIPITLTVILLDYFFLNKIISSTLPGNPHQIFLLNLLFGLPHILAGNFQILDREYIQFHHKGLILCLIVSIILPWSIFTFLGMTSLFIIEYAISGFHAAGQQSGILRLISKGNKKFYILWKWSFITTITLGTVRITSSIDQALFSLIDPIIISALSIQFLTSISLIRSTKETIGKTYIVANFLMAFLIVPLQDLGYSFFSILLIRLPHDLTAFTFYINHSVVRNTPEAKNYLVKALKLRPSFKGYFLPVLTIPIAFLLDANESILLPVILFLSYFHYTLESFFWKRTGLSIKSVNVVH